MSKILDLQNHVSITSSNEVEEIIRPLVDAFQITYFRYLKIFYDGSRIVLSNNPDGVRYMYETGHYKDMWFDGEFPDFLKEGWHAWSVNRLLDNREEEIQIEKDLNMILKASDGVSFVQAGMDSYEVFSFDADTPNVYAIEKPLLSRFMLYFKNIARKLIQRAESDKIIILNQRYINMRCKGQPHEAILRFLNHTKLNRFYLGGRYGDTYLTATEARCLYWLTAGKTAEETAVIEDSSVRTVETHLGNIKIKLNCQKQTQLVAAALETGIVHGMCMK